MIHQSGGDHRIRRALWMKKKDPGVSHVCFTQTTKFVFYRTRCLLQPLKVKMKNTGAISFGYIDQKKYFAARKNGLVH